LLFRDKSLDYGRGEHFHTLLHLYRATTKWTIFDDSPIGGYNLSDSYQ
jgi:hypothetical protein